jgi:hypothetical protein
MIIVQIDDRLHLADAGYPIPAAFPLDPSGITDVDMGVYIYPSRPIAERRWQNSRTSEIFSQNNFVLKPEPVGARIFRVPAARS